jgi:Ca2+-binding RTX toxin-like protein
MSLTRGNEWTGSTINGAIKAVLSDGTLLSTWTRSGAGGGKELVGQIYSSDGTPTGSTFVMKSYSTGSLDSTSVTALANGRFAITWVHNTDDFGSYQAGTGVFNSDGSVFKAPVQIGSNITSFSEVNALADGGYVMTYYDHGIKTVAFDASGTAGPTFTLPPGYKTSTAGLKAGGYVTVVGESNSSGSSSTIKTYLRKSDGQITETVIAISERNLEDFKVVGLANGNFAVVWNDAGSSAPDFIKAQIVNAQGALIGGQVTLYQHATASFQSLTVKALLDGGFALGFVQAEPQHDVYLGTYSETGAVVNAPVLVNQQTEGFQGSPNLQILKNGQILMRWYDDERNLAHYQTFDTGYVPPPGTDPSSSSGLTLRGTKGKDALTGGSGDDKFYGGYGNDKLAGMDGADVFIFNAKLGTSKTDRKVNFDTISDFKAQEDKIWLDNAIFKKLGTTGSETTPAALNKKFFKLGKQAGDKNDYVVYDRKTGILSYDADGSGAKAAIEIAKLSTKPKLSYLDFAIV